jgi:magnesium transporter
MPKWIDLVDPSPDEIRAALPTDVEEPALQLLLAAAESDNEARPTLQGHDNYIFGIFLVAVIVPEEARVFYQEVDVIVTQDVLLTISKTPPGEHPYDPLAAKEACTPDEPTGMMLYRLIDDIAERYLDLIDIIDEKIDELDDAVESAPAERTRTRLRELRFHLLHIRRTLGPTRDAVRRVVDGVIDAERGREIFPRQVELAFNLVYDKLLRAVDEVEFSRDVVNSTRDHLLAKIANDQNEVMKKLTVVASILLVPTFIVGLYGQNFRHHFPELAWQWGYLWSWALIILSTIAQIIFYKRRGWI